MSKPLPLTRRLEVALSETNSEYQKKAVHAKLYRILTAFDQKKHTDFLDFYRTLDGSTLVSFAKDNYSDEEISCGERMASILKDTVQLPLPNMTRDYRGKMIKTMEFEYNQLPAVVAAAKKGK